MTERRCGTCVFCDARKPEDIFCRRFPPTLVVIGDAVRLFYPSVNPQHEWCGEYRRAAVKRAGK